MALENAFGALALDATIAATNTKLDTVIGALEDLQAELNQKFEAGQQVALDSATLAALESVTSAVSNFPSDFPDSNVLAKLELVRLLLAGTLTIAGTVTANTGLSQPLTDTQLRASAVPISGTFWQATQPVSGTFFQATQPISAASLPLPSNAATETGGNLATIAAKDFATQTTLLARLSESDFDTKTGSLTESAPASDTASSGLNGRLQRIAQRITSLIAVFRTGQGTMTQSLAVVLSSDQSSIPVTGTFYQATQPVSGTFYQASQPVTDLNIGAQADAAATTDTGTFSIISFIKRGLQNWTTLLSKFFLGQQSAASSLAVTLSNENVQDLYVTGQSAQTTTVNNILTTTSGSAGTDTNGYRSFAVQIVSTGTGGTYIFEESNDNSNWQSAFVVNTTSGGGVLIGSAIAATSSSLIYKGVTTARYLRLRIATTITGGSIQAFTKLSQTPYSHVVFSVGQGTMASLNANVGGGAAHSAASVGNPVRVAGRVLPATPDLTLVAGDVSDMGMTAGQQQLQKPYAPAEWDFTFNGVITNSTTASVFKNAAGASIRNYVSAIVVNSDALATASEIVIKDGAVTSSSVSANVITSGTHDYKIGDAVVFSAIGSYTGISTATTYYVLTVPSATTYTLSATANGSTLTVGGSGSATSNRILFRSKLQTTSFGPASFTFPTPLRGAPNATLDFQCISASVTGSVYYNISGYIGF